MSKSYWMAKKNLKVYTHGAVGRGKEVEKLFKKLGVKNPLDYKFGDPWLIYYVNQNNEIAFTEPGSDIYYVITTSNDWTEMKLKQPKKERKFLITVKEGSSSCDGCSIYGKCTDTQKAKCQIAASLSKLMDDNEFTGKVMDIEELPN